MTWFPDPQNQPTEWQRRKLAQEATDWLSRYVKTRTSKFPRKGKVVEVYGGPCDGAECTWGEKEIHLPIVIYVEWGNKRFTDVRYVAGTAPNGKRTYVWEGLK